VYQKAGVIVMDFTQENNQQLNLFENSDPRHYPLIQAVDMLNKKPGRHTEIER
jgi:DNA polymerase V